MHPFRTLRTACALFLTAAALSGCVIRLGPGAAPPGLIYSGVTYPNELAPGMQYRIDFAREDIELLGKVETETTSRWYLFLISSGDSGYGELMKQVRAKGGDGVMNVTIDTEYSNVLIFYASATTKLSGLAYRYKRLPGDAPAATAAP